MRQAGKLSRRALLGAAAIALVGLVALVASWEWQGDERAGAERAAHPGHPPGGEERFGAGAPGGPAAGNGLASAGDGLTGDGAPPRLVAAAAALGPGLDVAGALRRGDWRWSSTVARLEDLSFVKDKRIACGVELGGGIREGCDYRVDMRVVRLGPDRGRIEATASELLEAAPEAGCAAFAACVARARLGEEIPLPAGDEASLQLSQGLQSTPLPPLMKNEAHLRKLLTFRRGAIGMFRSQAATGDPAAAHRVAVEEAEIRYLEEKLGERPASAP